MNYVNFYLIIASINQLLRMCWDVVNTTADEKIRLQAGALIDNCTMHRADLSTNGVVKTDALKYVNGKMDHLNNQENKLLQDIKDKEEEDTEDIEDANKELATKIETEQQQQTHNNVF